MLITIPLKRTYLVLSTCNRFLHIYLSRNATPWHHSRVSLWGRRRYNRYAAHVGGDGCCCESCKPNSGLDCAKGANP